MLRFYAIRRQFDHDLLAIVGYNYEPTFHEIDSPLPGQPTLRIHYELNKSRDIIKHKMMVLGIIPWSDELQLLLWSDDYHYFRRGLFYFELDEINKHDYDMLMAFNACPVLSMNPVPFRQKVKDYFRHYFGWLPWIT